MLWAAPFIIFVMGWFNFSHSTKSSGLWSVVGGCDLMFGLEENVRKLSTCLVCVSANHKTIYLPSCCLIILSHTRNHLFNIHFCLVLHISVCPCFSPSLSLSLCCEISALHQCLKHTSTYMGLREAFSWNGKSNVDAFFTLQSLQGC